MVDVLSFAKASLLGVQIGMTLALLAIGLTLVFGMMEVINFAHGSLYMLGAYIGVTVVTVTGNFWAALLIAPLLVGIIGAVIEVTTLRPLYGRNPLHHILLTFGIALVIQEIVLIIWGTGYNSIQSPAFLQGTVSLGLFLYPTYRLFLLLVSTVLVVGIWLFLTHSDLGIVMQASQQDAEMVDALAINVSVLFTGVFIFGAVLAALAGVLLGPINAIHSGLGFLVIIQAFAVVIIGGLGSFRGAVFGSLLVGFANAYGSLIAPETTDLFVFLVLAAVLLVRPTGIFGKEVA